MNQTGVIRQPSRNLRVRLLTLILLCVSLIQVKMLTSGDRWMTSQVVEQKCSATITVERPEWLVLANSYGASDLVAYPIQAIVFNLTLTQVDALKTAHQVQLSQAANGAWQICEFQ